MRSSRNQVRNVLSFFTEAGRGAWGRLDMGKDNDFNLMAGKASKQVKSKHTGRTRCYFPNPVSGFSSDKWSIWLAVWLPCQESPREGSLPTDTRQQESIVFVANLDTEILVHKFISLLPGWIGVELSGTAQPELLICQQNSLQKQRCGTLDVSSLSSFIGLPFSTIFLSFHFKTII